MVFVYNRLPQGSVDIDTVSGLPGGPHACLRLAAQADMISEIFARPEIGFFFQICAPLPPIWYSPYYLLIAE